MTKEFELILTFYIAFNTMCFFTLAFWFVRLVKVYMVVNHKVIEDLDINGKND